MRSLLPIVLLCACGGPDPEVHGWFFCDGSQSAIDWLVVAGARTEGPVTEVHATVFQDGVELGNIDMAPTEDTDDTGRWRGEAWEDDLGCTCGSEGMDVRFAL